MPPQTYSIPYEFPRFSNGDVEVIVSSSHRYKLHSDRLRDSNVLARLLVEPGVKLTKKTESEGQRTAYCLCYTRHSDGHFEFERAPVDNQGKTEPRLGLQSNNDSLAQSQFKAIDAYLKVLYDQPHILDFDDLHLQLLYAEQLLEGAELLEAKHMVVVKVENALLSHGAKLWQKIADDPRSLLVFGERIWSRPIFLEALVHCVGRYPDLPSRMIESPLQGLPQGLDRLVQIKRGELIDRCMALEDSVALMYPDYLIPPECRDIHEAVTPGSRAYKNMAFKWIAQTVYSKWLTSEIIRHGHASDDTGFELYAKLQKGGNAYMEGRSSLTDFFEIFPMNTNAINTVVEELNNIKTVVSEALDFGILRSNCRLSSVTWLTSTYLEDDEYPFFRAAKLHDARLENRKIVTDGMQRVRNNELDARLKAQEARAQRKRQAERAASMQRPDKRPKSGEPDSAAMTLDPHEASSSAHQQPPTTVDTMVHAATASPDEQQSTAAAPDQECAVPVADRHIGDHTAQEIEAAEALVAMSRGESFVWKKNRMDIRNLTD